MIPDNNQQSMLRVESLNTYYGKAQILFDLQLKVHRAEMVALLGRNGAGKTTTFKSIMGILPPRRGRITYKDVSIEKLPPFKTCALGLGYVPEDRRIFSSLSILENLEVGRQPPRHGFEAWTPERLFDIVVGQRRTRTCFGVENGTKSVVVKIIYCPGKCRDSPCW